MSAVQEDDWDKDDVSNRSSIRQRLDAAPEEESVEEEGEDEVDAPSMDNSDDDDDASLEDEAKVGELRLAAENLLNFYFTSSTKSLDRATENNYWNILQCE